MSAVPGSQDISRPMRMAGADMAGLAMVLGAAALTCLMNAALIAQTWHGDLGDPDDAMRLVEARAWLAGQPWFDMTAMRLDPPQGSFMHWSRLVDLPIAVVMTLFGLFTEPATAERLALVAVPTLWLIALYVGVLRLATLLSGRSGRLPMMVGMIFSGAVMVQFAPGRIGHHAPETVTLVFVVGCVLAALDSRHIRQGFIAGMLTALSLAMSLETLPFQVALIGSLVALWIWQGPKLAAPMGWFAAGLLVGLPLFFALTVEPRRWLAPVCDAYGAAHLGAGSIGAAGMLTLALASSRLSTPISRLVAASVLATFAGAFVAFAYPACLHSPFAGVDPLVRTLWLDHVSESLPLLAFLRVHPMLGAALIIPAALGTAGSAVAVAATRGVDRLRFILFAALSGFGLALALWQVRVIASVTPFTLCGGAYLVVRLHDVFRSRGLSIAANLAPLAILPFTSTVWALALESGSPSHDRTAACLASEALAPLAKLPPGTAVAPINSGSHLLKDTKLSVFAAPYHRNDDGNRFAFEVFMARPAEARALLEGRHVGYVIVCPGTVSQTRIAEHAPDGLLAQLIKGKTPAFLKQRQLSSTIYQVYDVVQPAPSQGVN